MEEPGGGAAIRGGRAITTSAVALSLGAGAHALGGGALPSTLVLVALGALVLLPATALARRQLRLWTLLPALAVLQVAVHAVLSFLSPAGLSVVVDPAPSSGHAHGGAPGLASDLVQGGAASVGLAAASPLLHVHAGVSSVGMLVAHAAAILVTAALLVGADGAARRALHWLRAVVPLLGLRVAGPVVASPLHEPARAPGFVPLAPGRVRSRPRRGPPVEPATA
ncbi:hypothetical protein [Pengzhenrongella frigida]|uniref:Uncharacterized protein n=1 Tax=Pengzhenrongella frigida TaxID=1259133 RepID=A0A4Q5N660_9MICO|nr:hypothetical protein [Cellulomonas sp. HLT2-17]RYV51681.1 hypothetical protein EUA98_07205 [Cellulomonas sp. HLT2-17]